MKKTTAPIATTRPVIARRIGAPAGDVVAEISQRLTTSQTGALEAAISALDATSDEDEKLAVVLKVLSVGLFVLGLDRAGAFCVEEFTDALHDERSDEVFNSIVEAGDNASDSRTDVEYAERKRNLPRQAAHVVRSAELEHKGEAEA